MPIFGLKDADIIISSGDPVAYHRTEFGLVANGDEGVHLRLSDSRYEAERDGTPIALATTGVGGQWRFSDDALAVVFVRLPDGTVLEAPAPGVPYGSHGVYRQIVAVDPPE